MKTEEKGYRLKDNYIKKTLKYFLFIITFALIFTGLKVNAKSLSINNNDYELLCKYSDGAELIISRDFVSITNTSSSVTSNNIESIGLYLDNSQKNDLYSSDKPVYRYHSLTEKGRCPSKLYVNPVIKVIGEYEEVDEDGDTDTEEYYGLSLYYTTAPTIVPKSDVSIINGWPMQDIVTKKCTGISDTGVYNPEMWKTEDLDDEFYLNYCPNCQMEKKITHTGEEYEVLKCKDFLGNFNYNDIKIGSEIFKYESIIKYFEDAYEIDFPEAEVFNSPTLVSEEVYLLTADENVKICDYKIAPDNNTNNQTIDDTKITSVYLFSNFRVVESDGKFTTLTESFFDKFPTSECIKEDIYLNDPSPKAIADSGGGVGIGYRQNAPRYFLSKNSGLCIVNNNNIACQKYTFLGERNGYSGGQGISKVCAKIGGKTAKQLQRIISILQIIVPVLTMVLTAVDIARIVLAGNVDEELPKKKKIITIRFCVAVVFFFLPLITNLLISMLQDAGVVGIESIECIYPDKE